NGTAENPFQVHDATQLNELRQYLGAAHTNVSFIQTADIDLTGISWMPIGTQANAFFGDFDGNGFKIRNLTISLPTTDYIGLFGSTNTSVFTRIALENASVTGNLFTGIMAGQVISSTIDRCYTTGSVTGNNNVGGLCGQNNGSFFTGSFSRANVFGVNSIGGFLGTSSSTFNPALVNCFASGNVSNTTTGSLIGGLIGAVFSGPVQNCYSIGAVNGIGTSVTLWGGLIGNSLIAISNSYYNTETSGRTDSNRGLPRTTDEMTFPHAVNTYIGWNFDTIWAPDLAGMNGGYPYLRSFVNTVEAGEVTVIVPDNVVHVPEINESTAVVVALPNYSNLTNLTVIGFTGTGAADLVVSVGAGNWYGLVYFNSSWHTSTPAFIEGPGVLTFAGVEFSAKGDVIVVLSEDIDPTLPVELSSFDAVLTAELFVNLTWVSESETNHSGYNVFRNLENTLLTAIRLNPGLISEGNQTGTQTTYKYTDMEVEANATYYYWLESVDLDGSSSFYGPVSITLNNQDPGQETPQLPMVTELLNAFPNPFNPQTTIRYSIREAGEVKIAIYNLKGQMIRSFTNNHSQAGYFNVIWDGYDSHGNAVGSGMYLYRMSSSNYSATRKMLLSK
ncbi:MAG: FlgD immunoglobulin-like domain containing protein, partial [Candidatus Cloacimonetes bacterium]|nr:FlgD immunoglobulin-like domain containing protein [Candidatus Cloacimonadota bacterium]